MVSQILKEAKKRKGVSNEWIAKQANIPLGTVNRILGGHGEDPKLSTILPICLALDVDLKQLAPALETLPAPTETEKSADVVEYRQLAEAIINKQAKEKKILFACLMGIVLLLLIIIACDIFIPHLGWVRY